jgi:hypothetical protein
VHIRISLRAGHDRQTASDWETTSPGYEAAAEAQLRNDADGIERPVEDITGLDPR